MKLKYIFSMVAGLFVMAATSCEDKAVAETTSSSSEEAQEVVATDEDEEAAAAYYVMFKGDGSWGIGKRARAALKKVEGVESIVLSGLRATIKMNDGVALSTKSVSTVLADSGLTFVSKSAVEGDEPKAVYVMNVGGVGWSDTEEKARVALNKIDKVSNVYLGSTTEVWLSEETPLDQAAITAVLGEFGLSVVDIKKADKSAM